MTTRRLVLATLALSFVAVAPLPTRAEASAQACASHPPTSASDYQSLVDGRSADFGVGDITSMITLPDGRRFVVLGDTEYFALNADGSSGSPAGFGNNSSWVQAGNCFTLLDRSGPGSRSWILPPQQDGTFYWPGASVVVGSRLFVFMQRIRLDSTFGTSLGESVAQFDLPSLRLARVTQIPWTATRVYGIGAVADGGYVYAYASQRRTCAFCFAGDMYVARVPEDQIESPSAWEFHAGSRWVADRNAATPVLTAAVSNTDVQHYGNGFLLITKTLAFIGPPVEAWFSPNPEGPWRALGTIFSVPDPPPSHVPGFHYQKAYTYNPVVLATAPLADGGYLASYNLNTFAPAEAQRDGLMAGPRFVSIHLPPPPPAPLRRTDRSADGVPPWTPTFGVDRAGHVRTVDGGVGLASSYTPSAVAVARTPTAKGGWVVASDGGVFAYGDAHFYGSIGGVRLNRPVVGIAATPSGHGYWLVASDGGVFAFGDARFYGSTGSIKLNRPILAMAASPTGQGYWFVASDGGVFAFGDAHFLGSTGGAPPGFPVTGMASMPDGRGYLLTTLAGQVFSFGDAPYEGNAPLPLAAICVGIVSAPGGYRLIDAAGNVFGRTGGADRTRIATSQALVAAG